MQATQRIRLYVFVAILAALSAVLPPPAYSDLLEADIETLQTLMDSGELSAEQLARYYIDRIGRIDENGPALNSIIEINPDALDLAKVLDEERTASGPRSRMHGIPVVLKANIDTADRMDDVTAGSLALAGSHPAQTMHSWSNVFAMPAR